MTTYNVMLDINGKNVVYSVKTACNRQFNVPERKRVISSLTQYYGKVLRIEETNAPLTLTNLILV